MKRLRLFLNLSLLVAVLAACDPGTSTVSPAQPTAVEPSAAPLLDPPEAATPAVDPTATSASEPQPASPAAEALPVATSRGPDLHATDPETISLASGGLQLVEFFRFT